MTKEILKEAEEKMKKAVSVVRSEFGTVRTGRASVSLLDRIQVEYFGNPVPLNQLASITAPEPRMLIVQPWDKSTFAGIQKAILQSDLGLTPSSDGNVIRLPVPPLTEERRKELVKVVKGIAEEGRVTVRNIRREANENLKGKEKLHEISEDDRYRAEGKVQELTDKYVEEIDTMLKNKEKEIIEV